MKKKTTEEGSFPMEDLIRDADRLEKEKNPYKVAMKAMILVFKIFGRMIIWTIKMTARMLRWLLTRLQKKEPQQRMFFAE